MRRWCGILLIGSVCCISCTKRPVNPTRESRRTIDTLFQKQIIALQPTMDSICGLYSDSLFTIARDSMLEERLAEMNELVK